MELETLRFNKNTTYVKIFGLQRSGTNYLTHLVNHNFDQTKVLVNVGGWKHGTYATSDILKREVPLLMIAKNPYAWLRSVYDYWTKTTLGPDLTNVTFEQFLMTPLIAENQRDVNCMYRAANPMQHWNNMHFHWLTLTTKTKRRVFVSYETLLQDLQLTLQRVGEYLELKPKHDVFEDCSKVFTPSPETPQHTNDEFTGQEYYLNKGYFKYYSADMLQRVNSQLDHDIMSKLNYQKVNP